MAQMYKLKDQQPKHSIHKNINKNKNKWICNQETEINTTLKSK